MFNKLYKTSWILIPVFVFCVLYPHFENNSSAPKPAAAQGGFVLPANSADSASAPAKTATPALAASEGEQLMPVKQSDFSAPNFSSKSIIVYQPNSTVILYSKNAEQKLPIASLTKLMTAIVASEDPNFDQPITITSDDPVHVAPELGLRVGDKVMPKDLIKAMLVGSANDAAQTLANHFPDRNDFLQKMNDKAQKLGMDSSHFSNPIGFDNAENYSTANDLVKLVNYALGKLPFQEIWQLKSYSFTSGAGAKYYIQNSNDLVLSHANIRSIKTGLTPEALGNMIVEAENKEGHQIISIVLGSENRDKDTLQAIDYVFKNFSWQ